MKSSQYPNNGRKDPRTDPIYLLLAQHVLEFAIFRYTPRIVNLRRWHGSPTPVQSTFRVEQR